ncbi:MAG: Fic family protein [Patescibacteria group bacterium]
MDAIFEAIKIKKKRLDAYKPFPKVMGKNMREWYKIELTYTSNAIEGNTLTRQETAQVVEKGITVEGKSVVEHLEAINHAKAFEFISNLSLKNTKDITEAVIRQIHQIILQNIDSQNSGTYRSVPVRIAGSRVVLPNPLKIPYLMMEFVNWLQASNDNPVMIALLTHFKFVSIHPFVDGNGRCGRLLMNLILMTYGYPPAIINNEDRRQYIKCIERAQVHDDLSGYEVFMAKNIEKSLDIYLDMLTTKEEQAVPSKLLTIGQLAKSTGQTVSTIRYWTKEGLLKVEKLSSGGYQLYSSSMIKKIKQVRALQKEKRLTIAELRNGL